MTNDDKRGSVGHTPTPWRAYADGNEITITGHGQNSFPIITSVNTGFDDPVRAEQLANADHIVLCVNAHEALVEALTIAQDLLQEPFNRGEKIERRRKAVLTIIRDAKGLALPLKTEGDGK